MTVMIEPGLLAGAVTPPPSKSQAHRLLIARALAGENIDAVSYTHLDVYKRQAMVPR